MADTVYYHVWFATKKRKWLLQGDVEKYVQQVMRDLGQQKNSAILEYETVVDHVHLLLKLNEKENLARVMNLLKGASSRKVFQQFPELKLDAGSNHFWQRRYGAKKVEPGALPVVSRYIRTQLERLEKFER